MKSKKKKPDNQQDKQQVPPHLLPYVFRPGQSGNPQGRPKGPTLKEWVRNKLMELDEEERVAFLKTVPRDVVWRMAEGNPATNADITSGGKPIIMLTTEIATKNALNETDSSPE